MRLAFLDTETTGTSSGKDRIIEIGVLIYEDNKITDTFSSLINPQIPVSNFITEITGINSNDLTSAPTFEDIALQLKDLLSDATIVAHNARFDYSFLRSEYRRLGIKFESPLLCTVRLSRCLYPHHHHHNLDSIIQRFNFNCKNRHRALDDAQVLVDFYQHLSTNFDSAKLKSEINHLTGHPSLPLHVTQQDMDQLPNNPGVYIFYDQNQIPLYVGKSKNLKTRVLSHFYDSVNSPKEMKLATLTHHIETHTTAGELSALMTESKLIKELQPLHNRLLRLKKKMIALYETIDQHGYHTVTSELVDNLDNDSIDQFLGIFKSQKQLKTFLSQLCDKYQLCPKIMGLENTSKNCFSYHLGKCKGACTKLETPLFYNLRFQEAFFHSRIKRWPFPGPILITESDLDTEISKRFLVDKWCLLREFEDSSDNVTDLLDLISPSVRTGLDLSSTSSYSFDLDTYKILKRFILNNKNQSKIKILKS